MNEVKFPEIQALYDWGTNFEWASSPFAVFLDLIGYSHDRWGVPAQQSDGNFGQMDLDYLGDALKEYGSHNWEEVYDFIDALLNENRSEESE